MIFFEKSILDLIRDYLHFQYYKVLGLGLGDVNN